MKAADLTGMRFGKLLVERQGSNGGAKVRWWCKCDCGNRTIIAANQLRTGATVSCGCVHKANGRTYLDRLKKQTLFGWPKRIRK